MITKELTREVEEWVAEHEPVTQDELLERFGWRGASALRELLDDNCVSYELERNMQTEGLTGYYYHYDA